MPNNQLTPMEQLNQVIKDTVSNISDFSKNKNDFTRSRKLNAENTIKVTLNMEGQALNSEMISAFPIMEERATASAYVQQKNKLSPDIFLHILKQYNSTNSAHNSLFNDRYMLYAVDGSDFNIPYQKASKYAMQNMGVLNKNGEPSKPYCQFHANMLYNITDRLYEDVIIQPERELDERDACLEMLKRLNCKEKHIVLMDRGYDGFNMIENCNRLDNLYYVIRTKAGNGAINEIANLPEKECDLEMEFKVTTSGQYYRTHKDKENIHMINAVPKKTHKYLSPNTRYQDWDFGDFETIKCRVCKFRINNADTGREEWEVLVTNLNRFEFPLTKMKELYHLRWDIETSFRELKYAVGGVQFHSRKDDFVEMELYAHLIMFNVVSRTINNVEVPQNDKNKHQYVLSFKDAVTLIRKYYRLHNTTPYEMIYAEMLKYTHPLIRGRKDKRKEIRSKSAVWFVYRVA